MASNLNVKCKEDENGATVFVENPYYKLILGKKIGGLIHRLDLKDGRKMEPLATSRLLAGSPIETNDPSKVLLDALNRKIESWIPMEPENFSDVKHTCEEENGKTILKFKGGLKAEKPIGELRYWLNYLLDDSPRILLKMGFQRSLDDSEIVPIVASLGFLNPGRWFVNSVEGILTEDFVVRHPKKQSIYSEQTSFLLTDRFWLSPRYPLSFHKPILGVERQDGKCSLIISDEDGSSRRSISAFYLEADRLEDEWVLCLRTLSLGSEFDYILFPKIGPLGKLGVLSKEEEGITRNFNWSEPFINFLGIDYAVENRHIKGVFARNRGGCIKKVTLKDGSEPVEAISGSSLLVAKGVYDPRFSFTIMNNIMNIEKNVDAAKCVVPLITQERRDERLTLSFHGYLYQLGPASFSVPMQKIQYYFKYGFNSSSELNFTAGIKPEFELKIEPENKAFMEMVSEWLGFTPDYRQLYENVSILLRLNLVNVEKYSLIDDKGSAHTSTVEKKNAKIEAPKDRSVKQIDVWMKEGSTVSFRDLGIQPETYKPKIYIVDGKNFDICFAWIDEEAYKLERDNWYEIGFKATFKQPSQ